MTDNTAPILVALADDHIILRKGLALLIDTFGNCKVILQADNGKELIDAIAAGTIPDVLILDQNMPEMDGLATARWLHKHHSRVHILMLSIYDTELFMIRLLQYGVKGFLNKGIEPAELKFAIESVMTHGYYYSHYASVKLVNLFRDPLDETWIQKNNFTDREIEFIRLCTTDLNYKQIGLKFKMNEHVIEKFRQAVFEKLDVQTRIGLVMVAMRHGMLT